MTNGNSRRRPLDEPLGQVIECEGDAARLPLPVRRFVEAAGGTSATDAIRAATRSLLASHSDGSRPYPPVSVEALCRALKVKLIGTPPSARSAPSYSANSRARGGHTGSLHFEGAKAIVCIPEHVDYATSRLSVAHELGHLLIHWRDGRPDEATTRLPAESMEEALAEYAARLLLLPFEMWKADPAYMNLAEYAVSQSSLAKVTLHSAVARLGDPDLPQFQVLGAILWRMADSHKSVPIHDRLAPFWHLCPGAFVPIRKSKARERSLVAELAADPGAVCESRNEHVRIGTFVGQYRVDALAWGSVHEGTRLVLSIFRPADDGDATKYIRNVVKQALLPLSSDNRE
jgi:hypothetical protein